MAVLAIVLAVVGVVLIVLGIVLFANGAGVNPEGSTEVERVRQGFARVPYRDVFGLMPRSVKLATDPEASRRDRARAAGSFSVLVGLLLICLAVLSGIAAAL
ncbi:MAG TPA: hypothetical protein VFB19_01910 [Mycobacterium sp.]|nr:hypothetical protein [Mycobacterium sp.]